MTLTRTRGGDADGAVSPRAETQHQRSARRRVKGALGSLAIAAPPIAAHELAFDRRAFGIRRRDEKNLRAYPIPAAIHHPPAFARASRIAERRRSGRHYHHAARCKTIMHRIVARRIDPSRVLPKLGRRPTPAPRPFVRRGPSPLSSVSSVRSSPPRPVGFSRACASSARASRDGRLFRDDPRGGGCVGRTAMGRTRLPTPPRTVSRASSSAAPPRSRSPSLSRMPFGDVRVVSAPRIQSSEAGSNSDSDSDADSASYRAASSTIVAGVSSTTN